MIGKKTEAKWLLTGGGDVGDLVRGFDWAKTSVGPLQEWPDPMRTVVQIALLSPMPIATIWGPEGLLIYNEGYASICGPRHPHAMGRRLLDIWPEARDFNARVIASGMTGQSLSYRAQELQLWRHGHAEQVWMDLEYTPVLDKDGVPIGIMAAVIDVTARVQTEQSLREKEARFRAFVNATSDMVYRMSPDWQELRELDGRGVLADVDRPTAVWLSSYIHEDDQPVVERAVQEAVRNKRHFEVETRVWQRDGSIGWALSRAVPFFDSNGDITEWFGSASDITARKKVELALVESESRFRGVFESGVVGFSVFDTVTGETLIANNKLLSLTGHTQHDFNAGRWDWRVFTPADYLPLDAAAVAEAQAHGYWQPFEKEYVHKDGHRIPVRCASAPLPGEPGRVIVVVTDLTHERQAELALRQSEELLRLATEAAEIGYWDVDPANDTLYWPPRVKAMFGVLSDREVSMRDFYDGLHPEDRDRVVAAFSAAADPLQRALYDVEYRTIGLEDEVLRWVAAKGRGIFNSDGRCTRLIGTAVDITARKQADAALAASEARLRELNETLEQRISERTSELEQAHESLRQAQKMQALGQLTGGIAHDFNNVLQAVVGSLSLIDRRPDDVQRVKQIAAAGLQAAQRGAKLTAQLLAFSRAQKMEVRPVAVAPVIENVRDMIGKAAGPSVSVLIEEVPASLNVMADETQLEMAILNLAMNARDAMPGGGSIHVKVALRQLEEDAELPSGSYIELVVSDTGEGMSPEVARRAFEPFFTTKGVGKGTGLGLSQVFGMTRQSGGTVRLLSTPGKGTTVVILLPLAASEDISAGAALVEQVSVPAKSRVLVIDDDPDVRTFLATALESLGYLCDVAQDGAAGLQRFQEFAPDVVIVDYLMPVMTGAEVAQLLKARRPDIPIVFASGYSETSAILAVAGPDAVILRKPFTIDQLNQTVREAALAGRTR